MNYQMPQEHLNEILLYLIQRPYKEVYNLVEHLKQANPVKENVEKL